MPVLLPQLEAQPEDLADSTQILHSLESRFPSLAAVRRTRGKQAEAWMVEDWLDESIGIATRFVYYEFRAGAGKQIYPSVSGRVSDAIGAPPVRH